MPSTAESNLRLELQATGENAATWGTKTNSNLELLSQAIAGAANVNVGGSGNYTLVASNYTSDEARAATLVLTGTLTGNRDVIVPTTPKHYAVLNQTSGAFTLTIRQTAGTGVAIPTGNSQIICTSTTCVDALGASSYGKTLISAASASPARTILGATSIGDALFVAADTSAARSIIGATSVGSSLIVATDVSAARAAISAVPTGAATASGLTLATARVLGRVTAGTGAIEEIPLGNAAAALSLGINRGTAQATTSGTTIDFTGIPAGVREITLLLRGVSMSGTERFLIQIGAGSVVTTGYSSSSSGPDINGFWVNSTSTSGFILGMNMDAASAHSGHLTLFNISGDIWVASGLITNNATGGAGRGALASGQLTLSGALDRLRLTNTGSNTFDLGEANLMWRF